MKKPTGNPRQTRIDRAIGIFKKHGGMLRTAQAMRLGIHSSTLYAMRDSGSLEQVSRGTYRLAGSPPLGNPDLAVVGARVPKCVICLISALSFHELTTQIPHAVHMALPRGAEGPRLDHPPIKIYRFDDRAFASGVDVYSLDGIRVRIYDAEKTIVDCFKFRSRIGLDTAADALRLYRERRNIDMDRLMRYAGICRVSRVIRPYLEALL